MLGEAALTGADADRYFDAYQAAIHAIGRASAGRGVVAGPGVSVKLSALHPRYHRAQRARVIAELVPRLVELARLAKRYDIGLAIDAEEADRLDLSLDLLAALAADPSLADWEGLGFVVQCYQKRARPAIDWIVALARQHRRRLMLRLVKGAYWDSEIKRAQVDGMPGYPVFTRKVHTDVAYLACAKAMLAAPDALYPQFASHNAFTIAAIRTLAGDARYEFQCLHGMGESIYDRLATDGKLDRACRIYAPVGSHETLLAYLVRRLLENGANSSFVNRIVDPAVSDRVARRGSGRASPRGPAARRTRNLPAPSAILPGRRNSQGVDLSDDVVLRALARELDATPAQHEAAPLLAGAATGTVTSTSIVNPADRSDVVGRVVPTSTEDVSRAIGDAREAGAAWSRTPAAERAACLERAADCARSAARRLHRARRARGGQDAMRTPSRKCARRSTSCATTRSRRARLARGGPARTDRRDLAVEFSARDLHGAGRRRARRGQPGAREARRADAADRARRGRALLHDAGVPRAALQLLPGAGETIGAALVADPRIAGVLFTGSTEVARAIRPRARRRATTIRC